MIPVIVYENEKEMFTTQIGAKTTHDQGIFKNT